MPEYPVEVMEPLYGEDPAEPLRQNVEELTAEVVGHRIVAVEKDNLPVPGGRYRPNTKGLKITLDNGKQVLLHNTDDCCAYTELESFLLNADLVDHVITGVGTTEEYSVWHVYADAGDVLELTVGWSYGNPFYYGYGFSLEVVDL